jgi:hypothetical protein
LTHRLSHASRAVSASLLTVMLACFCAASCSAQADNAALKKAEIDVFGGFLYLHPGDSASSDAGGTLGINYTRYFHLPVAPSFEVRANSASGSDVNEKSYLVGLRAYGDLHTKYHPYADFLIGKGNIHYNNDDPRYNPYGLLGDESAVFNYGGGVDIDVTHNFAAKIDVQAQRWRTGVTTYYYPVGVLVGINYRLPFRRYVSDREVH